MPDNLRGLGRNVPSDLAAPFHVNKRHERPRLSQVAQIYLPEVHPIPGATEFNPQVSKATAGVETGIDIGLSVVVPESNVGIVRSVTLQITDMLASTVVSWSLMFNGAPVPGWNNLTIFPRVSPYVGNTYDAFIRITKGGTLTFNYTNTDGGVYVLGAALSGWFWPQALGDLWLTQGSV